MTCQPGNNTEWTVMGTSSIGVLRSEKHWNKKAEIIWHPDSWYIKYTSCTHQVLKYWYWKSSEIKKVEIIWHILGTSSIEVLKSEKYWKKKSENHMPHSC